jgi:hypothetical protein
MVKKELAKKGLKMPHGYATIKRKRKISGVKKKKITETGILNRIHKVKKDVERLDEAQHKHMIGLDNSIINQIKEYKGRISYYTTTIQMFKEAIKKQKERGLTPIMVSKLKKDIKKFELLIKEFKIHITQLKKHI